MTGIFKTETHRKQGSDTGYAQGNAQLLDIPKKVVNL
jgi:hypothetical protein